MKPMLGMMVLYRFRRDETIHNNCASEAPAVIVRVSSDECVNLKVLADGDADIWKIGVKFGDQVDEWSWLPGGEIAMSA